MCSRYLRNSSRHDNRNLMLITFRIFSFRFNRKYDSMRKDPFSFFVSIIIRPEKRVIVSVKKSK